ncbi:hypothetical protein P691DRAFT_9274 [Macrolepiota fuliginosa MF-IS2]|uniref:Uncharacterized protein n=1 Tax=Macrolepiota fuliginosa MF-IS2 TaxID=1400762 RepID=A0A9P6C7D3_9AGAR|nr:hypothetical protein P691DRAFT_9274 [Macrolepiota fuliginosa MF-IS2]
MMLTQVFRQKDQTFANMLNEMRYGKMQESTVKIFQSLARNVTYNDGIEPSELYPTRNEHKTGRGLITKDKKLLTNG